MKRRTGVPRVAVALAVVTCVVAGVSAAAAAVPRAEIVVKAVPGTRWSPSAVTAKTGDTVTWDLNSGDGQPHNAAACKPAGCSGTEGPPTDPAWPSFKGGIATTGTETKYTFTQPGTYTFVCQVHDVMTGTIYRHRVGGFADGHAEHHGDADGLRKRDRVGHRLAAADGQRHTDRDARHHNPRSDGGPRCWTRRRPRSPNSSSRPSRVARRSRSRCPSPPRSRSALKRGKSTLRTVRLSARAGTRSVTRPRLRARPRPLVVEIEARDARGNKAPVQRRNVKVTR